MLLNPSATLVVALVVWASLCGGCCCSESPVRTSSQILRNCSAIGSNESYIPSPGSYSCTNGSASHTIVIASSDVHVRIFGGQECPRVAVHEFVFDLRNVSVDVVGIIAQRRSAVGNEGSSSLAATLATPLISLALRRNRASLLSLRNILIRVTDCQLHFHHALRGVIQAGEVPSEHRGDSDMTSIHNMTVALDNTSIFVSGTLGASMIELSATHGFNFTTVSVAKSVLSATRSDTTESLIRVQIREAVRNDSSSQNVSVVVEDSHMHLYMVCPSNTVLCIFYQPAAALSFIITAVFLLSNWSVVSKNSSWNVTLFQMANERSTNVAAVAFNGWRGTDGTPLKYFRFLFEASEVHVSAGLEGAVCQFLHVGDYDTTSFTLSHVVASVRVGSILDSYIEQRAAAVLILDRSVKGVAYFTNSSVVVEHLDAFVSITSGVESGSSRETNSSLFGVWAAVLLVYGNSHNSSFVFNHVSCSVDARNGTAPLYRGLPPVVMTLTTTMMWLARGRVHTSMVCLVVDSSLRSWSGFRVTSMPSPDAAYAAILPSSKFLCNVVAILSLGGNLTGATVTVRRSPLRIEAFEFPKTALQRAQLGVVPPRQALTDTLYNAYNATGIVTFIDVVTFIKLAQPVLYNIIMNTGTESFRTMAQQSHMVSSSLSIVDSHVCADAFSFLPLPSDAVAYVSQLPHTLQSTVSIRGGVGDNKDAEAVFPRSSPPQCSPYPIHPVGCIFPVDVQRSNIDIAHLSNITSGAFFGFGHSLLVDSILSLLNVTLRRAPYYSNESNATAIVYKWPGVKDSSVTLRQSAAVSTPTILLQSVVVMQHSGLLSLFPSRSSELAVLVEAQSSLEPPVVMAAVGCNTWQGSPIPLGNTSSDDVVFGSLQIRSAVNVSAATCGVPPPQPPTLDTVGTLQLGTGASTALFTAICLSVASPAAIASLTMLRTTMAVLRLSTDSCEFEVGPMDNPLQATIPVTTSTPTMDSGVQSRSEATGAAQTGARLMEAAVTASQSQGAVVANIGLSGSIVCALLCIGLVRQTIVERRRHRQKGTEQSTEWLKKKAALRVSSDAEDCAVRAGIALVAAAEWAPVTSAGLLAVSLVLQPIAACTVFLLRLAATAELSRSAAGVAVTMSIASAVVCGVVGLVSVVTAWGCLVCAACHTLPLRMRHMFQCVPHREHRSKRSEHVEETCGAALVCKWEEWSDDRWRWRVASKKRQWTGSHCLSAVSFLNIFGPLFQDYRSGRTWFLGAELGSAITSGILMGCVGAAGTTAAMLSCVAALWGIFAAATAVLLAAACSRPFVSHCKNAWFGCSATLTVLCSLLQAIGKDSAAEQIAHVQLVLTGVQIVEGCIVDVWSALRSGGDHGGRMSFLARIVYGVAVRCLEQPTSPGAGSKSTSAFVERDSPDAALADIVALICQRRVAKFVGRSSSRRRLDV